MSKKLLVADDSTTIREMVRLTFLNTDVEVLATEDGQSAIDLARKASPDLILADVNMPGMDGYDVCRNIRSDSELAKIPILLFTGLESEPDEELAAAVGSQGYAFKPFDTEQLIELVNQHAGQWVEGTTASAGEADLQGQDELEDIEILELDENDIEMIEDDSMGDLDIQPMEAQEESAVAEEKPQDDFDFMGAMDEVPEASPEPEPEPISEPVLELESQPVLDVQSEPEPELELESQPVLEVEPTAEAPMEVKSSTEPFATEIPSEIPDVPEEKEVVDEVLDYATEIPGEAGDALDYESSSSAGMDYSSIDELLDEIPSAEDAPQAEAVEEKVEEKAEEKPTELPPMAFDDISMDEEEKPMEFESIPSAEIIMDDDVEPIADEPVVEAEPELISEEPEPIADEPVVEAEPELISEESEPEVLEEPETVIEPEPLEEPVLAEPEPEEEFETIPEDDLELIPEDAPAQDVIEPKMTDDVVDLLAESDEIDEPEPEVDLEPISVEPEPEEADIQHEIQADDLPEQPVADELAVESVEPVEPSEEFEVTNVVEHPKKESPVSAGQAAIDPEMLKEIVSDTIQSQLSETLENLLPNLLQQTMEKVADSQVDVIEEKIASGLSALSEKTDDPTASFKEEFEQVKETQQGLKDGLEQLRQDVSDWLKIQEDTIAEKLAPLEVFPNQLLDRLEMMNDKLGVVGQQISGLNIEMPEISLDPVTDGLDGLKEQSSTLESALSGLGERLDTLQATFKEHADDHGTDASEPVLSKLEELGATLGEKFAAMENAAPQETGASEAFVEGKLQELSALVSSKIENAPAPAEVDLSEILNEFVSLRMLIEEKATPAADSDKGESVRQELMKFARWMDVRLKKIPAVSGGSGDGGVDAEAIRAALRDELGSMMGERVDAVVWEVVPDLVDTILKNELAKRGS